MTEATSPYLNKPPRTLEEIQAQERERLLAWLRKIERECDRNLLGEWAVYEAVVRVKGYLTSAIHTTDWPEGSDAPRA